MEVWTVLYICEGIDAYLIYVINFITCIYSACVVYEWVDVRTEAKVRRYLEALYFLFQSCWSAHPIKVNNSATNTFTYRSFLMTTCCVSDILFVDFCLWEVFYSLIACCWLYKYKYFLFHHNNFGCCIRIYTFFFNFFIKSLEVLHHIPQFCSPLVSSYSPIIPVASFQKRKQK